MLHSTEKECYTYKKYLRAQNIRWEKVDVSVVNEMWFSPMEIAAYRLKKYDILVSEGGEVGRAAMWNDELDECYIQNSVNRLRAKKNKILPEYLLYVLESYGKAKVFENTVNRVSIAHLTREKLKEYYISLPPLDEQRMIVADINKKLGKIDVADKALQKSIGQLEEYRTSLISSVITGKVEV
jgi:type I restriction enzyme, S subunit